MLRGLSLFHDKSLDVAAIPSGAVLLREAAEEVLATGPTTATIVAQVQELVMARPVATCRRLSECVLTGAMETCALIPVLEVRLELNIQRYMLIEKVIPMCHRI